MIFPKLTPANCEEVLNTKIPLGSVNIPDQNINNKIAYNIHYGLYIIYTNKNELPTVINNQKDALAMYNELNKDISK